MKKLALLACLVNGCVLAGDAMLKVFTWQEYFDPELILRFESSYNVDLMFIFYESDENRDQVMAETQGLGIDLILVDEAQLGAYQGQGWLAPLDKQQLSYLADHGDAWMNAIPEAKDFAVPYGWGTYGIVYRHDLVSQPVSRWADLFAPDHEISGAIQMSSQVAELLAVALMANGFAPFDRRLTAIRKAEASLQAQQSRVVAYKIPDLKSATNLLSSGTAKAAMTYSSDALFLMDKYDNLSFVSPEEGNIYWIDFWAISAASKQKSLAHQFLNFVLQPDVVAQNLRYHYSATFSDKAKALLPVELQTNKILYPDNTEATEAFSPPERQTIRAQMRLINTLGID